MALWLKYRPREVLNGIAVQVAALQKCHMIVRHPLDESKALDTSIKIQLSNRIGAIGFPGNYSDVLVVLAARKNGLLDQGRSKTWMKLLP